MAVITSLSDDTIRSFLVAYPVGELLSVEPSVAGIENTTYFIATRSLKPGSTASEERWVLTLIESANREQVDFTCRLLDHLAQTRLPVPAPLKATDGLPWRLLAGKPAWLIPRVEGRHVTSITHTQCALIGHFLASMHVASTALSLTHSNTRGLEWLETITPKLSGDASQQELLDEQTQCWRRLRGVSLPTGVIHADLFHDNALFREKKLVAVIDFLFSCTDWLLLDVAIAVNDWCSDSEGHLIEPLCHALLSAYGGVRPFTIAEHDHWQAMLALAATRFWVSRLQPSDPSLGSRSSPGGHKAPEEYLQILYRRLEGVKPLPLAL